MNTIKVTVPVYPSANDPWVTRKDNHYYYCFSKDDKVFVRPIHNLADMADTAEKEVWKPDASAFYSREVWAPELHYIRGFWYIYTAADNGRNENHRMLVLKGTSQDPTRPFQLIGKLTTPDDHWAIDGTILEYENELYFIWSGWEGSTDGKQNLYIAHMPDPVHIDSERVLLSSPELEWERKTMPINEGPVCITKEGCVRLVYSASASWTDDYCLGMMVLVGNNPMNPSCWEKKKEPIFRQSKGCYGPGHCSFIETPDNQLWIVYHANSKPDLGWDGRNLRMQKVEKITMDEFVIGVPKADGEKIEIPVE